ncbi:leptin receptor [Mugil cephalus]|uniref:leptin receptor n=1 Tax=Mugil cephalus TaxID=48193 RepID=UPI001FB851A2|nr:leptin receptor [Mugil cephalus]XP_047443680.1 leptin receptor [Mugil cephalus]XP_047443681.1 leptin receptor [Mugil cephalus]
MTPAMVRSVMLTVLMCISLAPLVVQCLEPDDGAPLRSGTRELPWQDELCCDSPPAHFNLEGGNADTSETNRSGSNLPHQPRCTFRSTTTESRPHEPYGGTCLYIQCSIDENWGNLTCDLQSNGQSSGRLSAGLSLRRLLPGERNDTEVNGAPSDNSVICEAEDSFTCSVALSPATSAVAVVAVTISDAVAPPVLLRVPARPEKPSPPVNISHIQTIEGELMLLWDAPLDFKAGPLRYEVRYSSNRSHPAWQVVTAPGERRLSLDPRAGPNYTIQVRCSGLSAPPLWSEWSAPYHIFLQTVSYIPEKIVVRPGENVTVYCVFNNRSINASTAAWKLDLQQPLHPSQYHSVNPWVSRITMQPSANRMYVLLSCPQNWSKPYSQIFVEGAFINITCKTNGDLDAMDCNWKNKERTTLELKFKWADLPCDVMQERERAGEEVGEMGPACSQVRPKQKTCTIYPLNMNCYKLWLEVPSKLGRISSKPVYLSPVDHVKPNPPTNVKAVSQSSGVLKVTWKPPPLPVQGVQCQFRYYLPSSLRAQPDWKVQSSVRVPWAEAAVPDMCRVYVVQVRCMHTNGTGYWSEWSDSVYSTAQNSRVPERGPNFWRIRRDDPQKNQSNITLLLEHLPVSGSSYCVDGFIVEHHTSSGSVTRQPIELTSSYSFEWNQEHQTVTVEAYNNLGSSASNVNMTLERQPKRRCVRSFHVMVINSTCVSLSWSLSDNSSVPLFMVVQWSSQRQQDSEDFDQSGETWARLPYTDSPVYLRGEFFGSEDYGFHLYPIFAEGEGEPVYTLATRGDPAAYMMPMIFSFLTIILFITLVLSQNQMKRFVWKDVPNPKKCSWAKGVDFKKMDTFDHMFRPPEGLQAWPLLLPTENISKVIIVDKALTTALIQNPLVPLTPDLDAPLAMSLCPGRTEQAVDCETFLGVVPSIAINQDSLTNSSSIIDELQPVDPSLDLRPGSTDSSAQSSVTYSTVLQFDPKQDQQNFHLRFKDGSGSSSSDEGNFSANNSDISASLHGGMWELDSCCSREMDDPRHSGSYNSVEELSETSEQEDEAEARQEKVLYYLRMEYPAEEEESEGEEQSREETRSELLKKAAVDRQDCSAESNPLLGYEDSSEPGELLSAPPCAFTSLYLPQLSTAPCTRQLIVQNQDRSSEP